MNRHHQAASNHNTHRREATHPPHATPPERPVGTRPEARSGVGRVPTGTNAACRTCQSASPRTRATVGRALCPAPTKPGRAEEPSAPKRRGPGTRNAPARLAVTALQLLVRELIEAEGQHPDQGLDVPAPPDPFRASPICRQAPAMAAICGRVSGPRKWVRTAPA